MKRSFGTLQSFLFILLLISTTTMFGSCSNNLQKMMDDYNQNFEPAEDEVLPPCPGDDDFDQTKMLFPTYQVCTDGTINLAGPYKCSKYSWVLQDKNGKELIKDSNRSFIHYLPKEFNNTITAGSYRITLTVIGDDGNTYSDSALMILYDRLTAY